MVPSTLTVEGLVPDSPRVSPAASIHIVKFERNRFTGQWRASCSCGWIGVGDEDAVKNSAAAHDLEWEVA